MNKEFLSALNEHQNAGSDLIIVTLVYFKGSAPQIAGAKIIVGKCGLLYGTVGGGKVETKAIEFSMQMLKQSEKEIDFVEWNLQSDVGMTCGGVVAFSFERLLLNADWNIAVFGAGHVAQELIRSLIRLNCNVMCIDPRPDWLAKLPEHPRLKKLISESMAENIAQLNSKTFIISMTMGHAFDLPILAEALKRNCFPYIGAIGSQSKAAVLKRDLLKANVKPEYLEKLICPIGEDFGNNTPEEIAMSITAQLLKVRDGK